MRTYTSREIEHYSKQRATEEGFTYDPVRHEWRHADGRRGRMEYTPDYRQKPTPARFEDTLFKAAGLRMPFGGPRIPLIVEDE